jgi:hypothetical protein
MAGIKQYTVNIGFTDEGGLAVKLTAGEDLYAGEVVQCTQGAGGADGKVYKNAVDGDMPIGVVYADALANASVWVVVKGITSVLPSVFLYTPSRGEVIYSSTSNAGRVDGSATLPAVAFHNREVGHFIYDGTGEGEATKAVIHFN